MILYFENFQKILYNFGNNQKIQILLTNIVHRARIRKVLQNISPLYYTYTITDSDTPEIIAHKYYGNSNYYWIIFFSNDIINPYYDLPLTYENFQATMISLYGSIQAAKTTIYQYTDNIGNVIDKTTFDAGPFDEVNAISAYDYWFNLNESKRQIKLLDVNYLGQVEKELQNLLSTLT